MSKNDWTVLVVDDQINVVNGIICGIHWSDINVTRVLKAYDAMEAKTILLQNPVDIMLCDIEMPRENGLQLYKWSRDMGMETECIFLTAHADFLYAKTAIQLESFDYILQPARYEEVETAVVRAQKKILEKYEQHKFYSYGKTLFQDRNRILDSLFLEWFQAPESEAAREKVRESLVSQGKRITGETCVYPFLMEVLSWQSGLWDRELFRYSCANILEELLGEGGCLCISFLEKELWCALIWTKAGQLQKEAAEAALVDFFNMGERFFSCNMAIYSGDRVPFGDSGRVLKDILFERDNNVALKNKIFFCSQDEPEKLPQKQETDFRTWENLLIKGYGRSVYLEACSWLEEVAERDCLDASALQRFYNDFVRILMRVEEKTGTAHEEIFPTQKQIACYLSAYANISSMKELLRTVTAFFNEEEEDENKSDAWVSQIKEYIYQNLDSEIRREDIAMEVFMNPSYVSRMFKKNTGISLKEFIIQEKMKMAQSLLKGSSLPVSIVALRVGYSNFSHFSQVYKKTFGLSPTEERK